MMKIVNLNAKQSSFQRKFRAIVWYTPTITSKYRLELQIKIEHYW